MPIRYVLLASVLATAGDLVFTGDPEGYFFALDARTGNRLWSFQTGAGNRGSAVSYSVNGRQYIATPTGWQQSITGAQLAPVVPRSELARRFHVDRVRTCRRRRNEAGVFLLLLPAFGSSQSAGERSSQILRHRILSRRAWHAGGAPRLAGAGSIKLSSPTRSCAGDCQYRHAGVWNNTLARRSGRSGCLCRSLNGIANACRSTGPGCRSLPALGDALSPEAERGRALFFDAVRSFGRCSTCHEVNGIGIPVTTPIAKIPADVAALRALATPGFAPP